MSGYKLTYSPYGNQAILIEWPAKIDQNILKDVLKVKKTLLKKYIKVSVEVINTYSSITIYYHSTIENIYNEIIDLKSLNSSKDIQIIEVGKRWEIPVCYDLKFGLDLPEILDQNSWNLSQLIDLHSTPIYTVYFIGFLPGFLYLGGLPSSLHMERKNNPRMKVERGAVGIGGQQTGIYPQNSPGGWQIIGKSPINFFDLDQNEPCFASSGDEVVFKSISIHEYEQLDSSVKNANYKPKSIQL